MIVFTTAYQVINECKWAVLETIGWHFKSKLEDEDR
jgi:hypothetical protein